MISSTFYDLRQVRRDLRQFIEEELGYQALLSEHHSFPVDPDEDTIENCRRRVEQNADVLVLIIGGRYGSVDDRSAKSITNLEYLAARTKGIPVYAFVDKGVLALLPVWKKSPDADFSHAVDDVRVFDFIRKVRSVDKIWMHEFEYAQDVVKTIRVQFAHLMNEGLKLRLRLRNQGAGEVLQSLHGMALRLAVEQPEAWDYRLFAQVLTDEIENRWALREEHRLGIVLGPGDDIPLEEAPSWVRARLAELEKTILTFDKLGNEVLQKALKPSGQPGDVAEIVFVARKVGQVYQEMIEWSQRIRRANIDECFRPVALEMAEFMRDTIERIEAFGPNLLQQIEEALEEATPESPKTITATLKIDLSNLDRFSEALRQTERECF